MTEVYLSDERDVEANALSVAGASVHVVAHEEDQLEDLLELPTLLQLLLCGRCHDNVL